MLMLQAFSLTSCRVLGPTAVCVEAKAMSLFSGNPYLYEVGEECSPYCLHGSQDLRIQPFDALELL